MEVNEWNGKTRYSFGYFVTKLAGPARPCVRAERIELSIISPDFPAAVFLLSKHKVDDETMFHVYLMPKSGAVELIYQTTGALDFYISRSQLYLITVSPTVYKVSYSTQGGETKNNENTINFLVYWGLKSDKKNAVTN